MLRGLQPLPVTSTIASCSSIVRSPLACPADAGRTTSTTLAHMVLGPQPLGHRLIPTTFNHIHDAKLTHCLSILRFGSADGQIWPEWEQSAASWVLGVEPIVITGAGHSNIVTKEKYAARACGRLCQGLLIEQIDHTLSGLRVPERGTGIER